MTQHTMAQHTMAQQMLQGKVVVVGAGAKNLGGSSAGRSGPNASRLSRPVMY